MTLYLKYRPQDFDSLVWQEFVKETLKQAVVKDKLVGSYLFCWPRWTGKTSSARIFAKAINCLNPNEWNPCWECEICKGFQNNSLTDIIEIDAASNTWVDNVREIIERAKFLPNLCKYKVYIIDEVHMLSKWAFNALLKILEEPPKHLKFILATTEIHKIPDTILSRCQRYDFKSIWDNDLRKRLEFIAKSEWITVDEESYDFIIKQSNGWARNAISLFEQLITWDEIRFEKVINSYWVPQDEKISEFFEKILNNDPEIISDFEKISKDFNIVLFYKELLFFTKNKILENIENSSLVNNYIRIFENLEQAFLKSKNTFDINTTLLIWIIKSISNYSQKVTEKIVEKKVIPEKKSQPKKQEIKTPVIENPIVSNNSETDISADDLFDVFGDWETTENENVANSIPTQVEAPQKIETVSTTPISSANSWNFDKNIFIDTVKLLKAPWALTMSLRWSSISFDWKILTIYTKTKIALKQVSSADNVSLMSNWLNQIWYTDIEILVK